MSRVVADASLAVKWVLQEEYAADAVALLTAWRNQGMDVVVPNWFVSEVTNILYRRSLKKALTLEEAKLGVIAVLDEVVVQEFDLALASRAMDFAQAFGQGASYDSQYVAFAERLGCEFWTADEKLWNASRGTLPWFRWIGETAQV